MPQSAMEDRVSEGHKRSAYRRFWEHMSISLLAPLSILLESLSGLICGRSHYSKLDYGVSSVNGEHVGDSAAEVAIRSRSRLEEMQALPFPTAEMHLKIHLLTTIFTVT
ncbi:hypothetical protein O6H91_14G015000 [Diphasiastrum complanatum]|uniref:Uncharacterized protein n=1 Tax=Diphasiastrum complanatum TaxID=34168 RepID=A0ACC2BLS8_DIPCM|nr:hypothetical protein O6H91_Y389200 [Diphasiastrum complanatum]KAJ7530686.1 hypothetical protein O6H91_14G015000 [Diphasiastrum complanatum]